MKKINKYIKDTNENLKVEKGVVNAPDTEVSGLRAAIVGASRATALFNNVVLRGDTTELPVLNLPDSAATSFTVDGITINRANISTSSLITDETLEDAVPDMGAALNNVITTQTILKMESAISEMLTDAPLLTGTRARAFETVTDVLNTFPDQYNTIVGEWYVFGSHKTLRNLLVNFSSAHMALRVIFGIDFVPVYGLPDNELVIGHQHGLAGGFRINSVELDRRSSIGSTTLLSSASAGIGFDPNFVKKVVLSN